MVIAGRNLLIRLSAQDPDLVDRYRHRIYAKGLPPGVHFTSSGIFMWRPVASQRGTYKIQFYVYDPLGAMDDETINIIVR
jgi:hypothetical protein